ncbi:hypothetical protein [Dactylosporangium sp. CA-092794]|uniref:hypothetical protein n=1 Tax=Dactylosporangium sp. CA-092794 TaxID=3239929 RepID=UPI003D8D7F59
MAHDPSAALDPGPALGALRAARAEAAGTLSELIRMPSVGGSAAESEIVHHVAARPARRGGAVRGAPYGSDLRLLTAAGIPAVRYGPGVGYGHRPDERVSLPQVHACAETLIRLALAAAENSS